MSVNHKKEIQTSTPTFRTSQAEWVVRCIAPLTVGALIGRVADVDVFQEFRRHTGSD